jgi:energy-coupling factor transporter ATP-binding protein EcfA2
VPRHRARRAPALRRPPGDRAIAALLAFEGVTYAYPDAPRQALRDVDLVVEPGEFVVVAGPSAGGKSTLLRAACGLVPHFHGGTFGGRVTAGGLDTREHGPGAVAAVAGSLFQDPETQVVLGTVRAELAFGLENRGAPPGAVARGVEEVALALGIEALLDRPSSELSGGELQRVALGAALAGRPPLLLLDEPTSQLDPVAGDELIWLLRRLNEEWGTAVLLAEHRLERCLAQADRVVVVAGGAIACDAAPREFLSWAAREAPALQTPGARLLERAGLRPPPAGVKEARATLRAQGLLDEPESPAAHPAAAPNRPRRVRLRRVPAGPEPVLACRDLWQELPGGRAILRSVDLELAAAECVALMGRNGAGKSTLLRHLAGLDRPTRGRVERAGRAALLLQNPNDYLLHERVGDEASASALDTVGLAELGDSHPRDLSGGQRQRLALAIVLDGEPPAAVLLDEPTRGMDRAAKGDLADRLRTLARTGVTVLVATHDVEFAAAFAQRVVLMADGRPIADGPVAELLSGGWYFATETARILGGAGGALTPEAGAEVVRRRMATEVPAP